MQREGGPPGPPGASDGSIGTGPRKGTLATHGANLVRPRDDRALRTGSVTHTQGFLRVANPVRLKPRGPWPARLRKPPANGLGFADRNPGVFLLWLSPTLPRNPPIEPQPNLPTGWSSRTFFYCFFEGGFRAQVTPPPPPPNHGPLPSPLNQPTPHQFYPTHQRKQPPLRFPPVKAK